ncbi:hypothetical protein QA640_32285 [Bradyrhizobium sp. CB82]|uniref:hypothetical protein n=1 Tax=Bradyrhizobium sp. CB82 TaxID=3039159 RepID=UPI0024B16FAF|nr:hypothetical protein [Bradyrhizobium sp. CB82]WFU39037.1 hypothetical protein QA640_32285 [Bradyrhizobium sp. CB82]
MPYRMIRTWSSPGRRDNRQRSPPRTGSKRGTKNQAIGKSKGGWTTLASDALGNLVRFILLPAISSTPSASSLIKDIEFGGLIADKAFDSNWIIEDPSARPRSSSRSIKDALSLSTSTSTFTVGAT